MSDTDATPARLVVLATGGTIACTSDRQGHLLPTLDGESLVRPIADRFPAGSVEIEVREVAHLDSASMTLAEVDELNAVIHELFADPSVDGIIVTHGTDSMEETAMAVDVFHADERPVVFTGAQKPADHPEADGPNNLFEAMVVAMDASARGIGVLIVFGHAVLPVRGAVKWHTTDDLGFATNAPEDPVRPAPLPLKKLSDVRVDIIAAHAGSDGTFVDAAVDAGAAGLVVEGMGAGNVGTDMAAAIGRALEADIPVVMCTRVPRGDVHGSYGGAGGGATLAARGVVGSGCVHAPQARIILAAAIAAGVHPQTLF